jgi:hypothetical protein
MHAMSGGMRNNVNMGAANAGLEMFAVVFKPTAQFAKPRTFRGRRADEMI